MKPSLLDDFCRIYQSLDKHNLALLKDIYSEDVVFIDAMHQVSGINSLTGYFEHLYENIDYCNFHIHQLIEKEGQACVIWKMDYAHPKLNGGKCISVDGASHLQFSDKIDKHRDYLDLGQMLYEHLPLLGSVIKTIKKRASQ
ncbi:MAG: nuclear transport factor 2 family protein [Moritella sp.]|uniref:nuclear transport factor 2 family protein n=1 Tax=Moritella sp. TaxID=78556 RepID=UPI0029B2D7F1|nr:nuclear transport factor 2 family protein [Moritella sp.]MDX2319841.1 nuclear transport factor 2 family protein [Moritella sp.]